MWRLFLSTALVLAFVGASLGETEPRLGQSDSGGAPLPMNPNVCWSEPPDFEGLILSSQVIGNWEVASELAGDFMLGESSTIVRARWWGGYYDNTEPCDPGVIAPGFNLRFYEDDECLPTDRPPFAEIIVEGSAGETFVGCQSDFYPLYRYEAEILVIVTGGIRSWFSAQMASLDYPPLWGRLSTTEVTDCDSAWKGSLLQPPWWIPVRGIFGYPLDFSLELDCETAVAVEKCSWGRIKGLYR